MSKYDPSKDPFSGEKYIGNAPDTGDMSFESMMNYAYTYLVVAISVVLSLVKSSL
jgi:hypothetical protein